MCRPLLPRAELIVRYMALLDNSRRYANRGELVELLETRLAAQFGISAGGVSSASSGTAALVGAILAATGRATIDKPLCFCPSYTFVAAAFAAELCGYRVFFVDVDERTWQLDPEVLVEHTAIEKVGVVVVTEPYGRSAPKKAWTKFTERTGIPVVIDAGASIETLTDDVGSFGEAAPMALSLHATKAFGVGEGGLVVCPTPELLRSVHAALNFGFAGVREASGPGFNGKMSEYHAAVGLAELDGWPAKRASLRGVADAYRSTAAARELLVHAAPTISSCYVLFEAASEKSAEAARAALSQAGVDYRLWYGLGLHREAYFRNCARDPLPIAEALAPRLIGLPVAPDLPKETIERIVAVLAVATKNF